MCWRARRRISWTSARNGWSGCIVAIGFIFGHGGHRVREHGYDPGCKCAATPVFAGKPTAPPISRLCSLPPELGDIVRLAMSEAYIRAANLSKVYKSGTADLVVFANVDLDVQRGE